MASKSLSAVSAFIAGTPPGELPEVIKDIKALTTSDAGLLERARPAFQAYHEDQLSPVKLPGSSKHVLISKYNQLQQASCPSYYDLDSRTSWTFDPITQAVSDVKSYVPDTLEDADLLSTLHNSFSAYARNHYPTDPAIAILPPNSKLKEDQDDTIPTDSLVLLLSASKYSPSNFWTGRFRCRYHYSPRENTLTGQLQASVHYYEDGNVRLTTHKTISAITISTAGTSRSRADQVVRQIGLVEKAYHEELNRAFANLSEGAFKALRRQLPVTRQKMEWEKVGSYRAGKEIQRR